MMIAYEELKVGEDLYEHIGSLGLIPPIWHGVIKSIDANTVTVSKNGKTIRFAITSAKINKYVDDCNAKELRRIY